MSERHIDADAYVDGVADAGADAHLAQCSRCRDAVHAARRLADAIAAQPVPDPGDAYWARFAERVESRLPARSPGFYERFFGWFVPSGRWGVVRAATAVAAATFLVYVGMRGYRPADLRPSVLQPEPRPTAEPHAGSEPKQKESRDVAPPNVAPPPVPVTPSQPADRTPNAMRDRTLAAREAGGAPEETRAGAEREVARRTTERQVERQAADQEAADKSVEGARRDDAGALSEPVAKSEPAPTGSDAPQVALPAPAPPPVAAPNDAIAAPGASPMQARDSKAMNRDAATLSKRDEHAASPAAESLAPADRFGEATALIQTRGAASDPVVAFVIAAAAHDTAAAAAAARSGGIAPNDAAAMQRWLNDARKLPGRTALATPVAAAGLDLESLAWPRRDAPGMRSALGSIASELAAFAAADARAAARARALADWLAATSATAAERARWEEMLKALPAP